MKKAKPFRSAKQLNELIDSYFRSLETDSAESKILPAGPSTFMGLLLFLGFSSREEFDQYAVMPRYAKTLSRAALRIAEVYEKKLHDSSSGAVFALKNMGWNERTDNKPSHDDIDNTLKIEVIRSGPKLASSEKEVVL